MARHCPDDDRIAVFLDATKLRDTLKDRPAFPVARVAISLRRRGSAARERLAADFAEQSRCVSHCFSRACIRMST
jgi:hypothetical protein